MLRQEKSDLDRYRDERALNAFHRFLQDIAVQQKEKQKAYFINEAYPQVFLSYAWKPGTHPSFIQLQAFLNALRQDFEQALVWV